MVPDTLPQAMTVADGPGVSAARSRLLRLCMRTMTACAAVSGALLLVERPLIAGLLPYFDVVIRLLQPDFVASLRVLEVGGQWMIQMTPLLVRAVALTDQAALRPFVELQPFLVHVKHALVPLVVLGTGAASWPVGGYREAVVRALLTVAALPLLLAVTTPLLLVGRMQMWVAELAMQRGAAFHEPPLVTLMIFMESGGNWLVPLALAVAVAAVAQRSTRRKKGPEGPFSVWGAT